MITPQFYRTPLTECYFLWLPGSFIPWNQPSHPSRSNFLPKLTVEQLTDTAFLTKKVTNFFFVDLTAGKLFYDARAKTFRSSIFVNPSEGLKRIYKDAVAQLHFVVARNFHLSFDFEFSVFHILLYSNYDVKHSYRKFPLRITT